MSVAQYPSEENLFCCTQFALDPSSPKDIIDAIQMAKSVVNQK